MNRFNESCHPFYASIMKQFTSNIAFTMLLLTHSIFFTTAFAAVNKNKSSTINVYQLQYQETEPGIDAYKVRMLVSKRYIRIDTLGDNSGYIIFDGKKNIIYSLSHFDRRILVINPKNGSKNKPADNLNIHPVIEYMPLVNAPKVAGKTIYNYRVFSGKNKNRQTCMTIQLVKGLLPAVTRILKKYQQLISAQQVVMLKNTIKSVQTPCYLIDQIFNAGLYYDKGLPIQEWHSNQQTKILLGYKQLNVDAKLFDLPASYSRFSIPLK